MVETLRVTLGAADSWNGKEGQWLQQEATKRNGNRFTVWLLCEDVSSIKHSAIDSRVVRYLLKEGEAPPVEYRHGLTQMAVLPNSGAWRYMFPSPQVHEDAVQAFPETVEYLGHKYQREDVSQRQPQVPTDAKLYLLRPDVLTGVPSNTRQADETRRYDDSDYAYVPLTVDDFKSMIAAGLNCFRADAAQADWFEQAGVFYWGVPAADLPYPECLYRPLFIGPVLFIDEPMVHVRDYVLRPRLREDADFRRSITPQDAMTAFERYFADVIENGAPTQFMKGLQARPDVNLGTMQFIQPNVYSWETMISSSAYQLLYNPGTPNAIVFEPPGRVGTRRLLPAMNMSYGCQIPVMGSHFIDIIIGFLRGAARASGKEWGISIYGAVDRTDAPAFISRAYELGATRFFYWDSAASACVPFGEVLGLTRHLSIHAREFPNRDLTRLLHAAEVAILLPPGYNLGHVYMGKGVLWGITELNLERLNRQGVSHRAVMGSFFTEIERCLRHGVAFDLFWDLPQLNIESRGYREVVRVREDAKVQITADGQTTLLDGPRTPDRPKGRAPQLEITLAETGGTAPCAIGVNARVREGDAPVYYAPVPDANGVHVKLQVLWELYGPEEHDYSSRAPQIRSTRSTSTGPGMYNVDATLYFEKPGRYRLRGATTDLAGRSAVVWKELLIR